MKERYKKAHMKAAFVYADLSYCVKRKVGCIAVKNDTVVAFGFNGTEPGEPNCCEDKDGNTHSGVVHAEENMIRKLERDGISPDGVSVFVTKVPCEKCAQRIIDYKIPEVFYCQESRTNKIQGKILLKKAGIHTEQVSI